MSRLAKDHEQPVYNLEFAIAAGAANHCTVTITAKDKAGNLIGEQMPLLVWISDSSSGAGNAAVSPTDLGVISGGGTYLQELLADSSAIVLSNNNGQFKLDITDAVTQVYYVAATPLAGMSGFVSTSRILAATDFGA